MIIWQTVSTGEEDEMTKMRDLFGYKRLSEQQKRSLEKNGLAYAKREKRVWIIEIMCRGKSSPKVDLLGKQKPGVRIFDIASSAWDGSHTRFVPFLPASSSHSASVYSG